MIGQTSEVAPADRKLYALRDATGTVESIPLICASIMSKKLAEGLDGLVLDVKTGEGAFMTTFEKASDLARSLVDIGNGMGTKTVALITDMNQPLGLAVGNALEVREAIETLRGQGPEDFTHLCEKLATRMLALVTNPQQADGSRSKITDTLNSGKALQKLAEMIEAQGGNPRVIDDLSLLPKAAHQAVIGSEKERICRQVECQANRQSLNGSRSRAGDGRFKDRSERRGDVTQKDWRSREDRRTPLYGFLQSEIQVPCRSPITVEGVRSEGCSGRATPTDQANCRVAGCCRLPRNAAACSRLSNRGKMLKRPNHRYHSKVFSAVDHLLASLNCNGQQPRLALILGSGFGAFAESLSSPVRVPYSTIPHFPKSSVAGHSGNVVFGKLGKTPILCLQGRIHYYEGHDMTTVTFPVRVLGLMGIRRLILTNAAGGIHARFRPGDLMLIRDHISSFVPNPLIGPNEGQFGPRFPDMTEAYSLQASSNGPALRHSIEVSAARGHICQHARTQL